MEIVDIQFTGNQDRYQQYEPKDLSLLNTVTITNPFGSDQDYVEYFIYDINGNLLASNYSAKSYSPINPDPVTGTYTSVEVDPEGDVRAEGYNRGSVNISYNFFRKLFNSDVTKTFWIKEISGDRTELRVCRQDLSNIDLQQAFTDYTNLVSLKAYYPDFYLNFGDDNIIISVNVLYALQDEEGCLLIKLYEPLPDDLGLKDTFWIVDKLSDSANFNIDIEIPAEVVVETNTLRGPNFTVDALEKLGQTTPAYNYSSLFGTSLTSSYQQLKSLMEEKGLDINVDYTDFSNFVHFSSATERIYNFAYKVQQIENYNNDIAALDSVVSSTGIVSGSKQILQNSISTIIEKFDGYEYYLYYTSASDAWPKATPTPPYTLYPVTSSQAIDWLGSPNIEPSTNVHSILYSASQYDNINPDALTNTIPDYLKSDNVNVPYLTFLNMVGQHFDNIWIYLKDVTERYDAENNLDKGISKDLVGDALRALGIKLYTNTSISDNIYYSLLAINPDGSLTPPTGSEVIDTYIPFAANGKYVIPEYVGTVNTAPYSASLPIAGDDITKEYYKRLYHNVPYLLKTKGTSRGLRALINCFGIPDTILRINEYGGSDKLAATPDLVQRRHSLAYYNSGSANLSLPWAGQNYYYVSGGLSNVVPDTIEFRFKSTGIPDQAHTTQTIIERSLDPGSPSFLLNLTYNSSSAVPSSSYEYYGNLGFYMSNGTYYASASAISLPFYNPDIWWNVMLKRDIGQVTQNTITNTYRVYVKGTAYDEEGNATIAYEASQSIYATGSTFAGQSINDSWIYISNPELYTNKLYTIKLGGYSAETLPLAGVPFQGYFQELRYWATPLSESAFNEHVINSTSYRGNNTTASLFDLTFRLPLGSNLNIPYLSTASVVVNPKDYDLYELGITAVSSSAALTSYHPAVTGTLILPFNGQVVNSLPSFISGSTTFSYGLFEGNNSRYFQPFEITDLIPTPSTGVNQKVNNKVSVVAEDNLAEDLLSPFVSIQRYDRNISKNSTDIEVAFSPSDVVDLDISNQLGYFNIDEYIGSPSDAYSSSYQPLDTLRTTYFEKYVSKYNVEDFIRLIKYYDNSLFKMIKDFVPARANLSTGIVVKPHILERPKYPRHEPIVTNEANWSGSIEMVSISGSNPEDTYLNTSYTQSLATSLGTVTSIQTDLSQPFTGDFGGNELQVTDNYFSQTEVSSIIAPWTSSIQGGNKVFTTYSINPLENNALTDDTSTYRLKVDYSSNPNVPVNLGLITASLALYPVSPGYRACKTYEVFNDDSDGLEFTYIACPSQQTVTVVIDYGETKQVCAAAIPTTGDPLEIYTLGTGCSRVPVGNAWPSSEVNDYNWQTFARTSPRYLGAEMVGLNYNTYTTASQTWAGDKSYGKTAVIDKLKYQYAYLVNIYTASFTLPGRSNAQIKYLIDNQSNTLNLNKSNPNIFDIQNIFKSGESLQVALFDFNPDNPDVQVLTNNKTVQIYEGGYRYSPTIYNTTAASTLTYKLNTPILTTSSATVPSYTYIQEGQTNYWFSPGVNPPTFYASPDQYQFSLALGSKYGSGGSTQNVTVFLRIAIDATWRGGYVDYYYISKTVPSGSTSPYSWTQIVQLSTPPQGGDYVSVSIQDDQGNTDELVVSTQTTYSSTYTATLVDTSPNWYAVDSYTIKLSSTQSLYYEQLVQSGSDTRVETPVFPICANIGDRIKLYTSSSNWGENEEYVVASSRTVSDTTGSFRYITLDRPLNPAVTTTGNIPSFINKYITLKHVPDETNLIVRYAPTAPILQDGLAIPQYIDPVVQANAGNVVQSLKANNLI